MFNRTWEWAGRFRRADTNIGLPWHQIPEALRNLCDDLAYQVGRGGSPWDDLAIRFHHRLVVIHPFPNGNGRHARMATDLLLHFHEEEPFTWGSASLIRDAAARQEYLAALREADRGDFRRLTAFGRS
jgi:Fic-DOC domain mobile mystery protein B